MDRESIECWLTDMDGVLVRENSALPGAAELLAQWRRADIPFLVLTNNSIYTARDLSARLRSNGLEVPGANIWTSAMARADCLSHQVEHGTAYVVGEAGLTTAIHEAGFIMTEHDPDFVVVGETHNYSFEAITKAIRLIDAGSRFIVTNPDATGPSPEGVLPATGAIAALITKTTNRVPYVVGKPNPMMFRSALNKIGAHSISTAMIGDRMDTDIIAGMEAGMHTVLVLSGISTAEDVRKYPFRPDEILDGVFDLLDVPLEEQGSLGADVLPGEAPRSRRAPPSPVTRRGGTRAAVSAPRWPRGRGGPRCRGRRPRHRSDRMRSAPRTLPRSRSAGRRREGRRVPPSGRPTR